MRNVTPPRGPAAFFRVFLLLLGFLFTAWEARMFLRQLSTTIRKISKH